MAFQVESRHLEEVVVLTGKAYEDARGYSWRLTGKISSMN